MITLTVKEIIDCDNNNVVAFELVTHPGYEKVIVWADQKVSPGFMIGNVSDFCDNFRIGKSVNFKNHLK